jgi:hypothetical protein
MFPPLGVIELIRKGAGSAYHATITSDAAPDVGARHRVTPAARHGEVGAARLPPNLYWFPVVQTG